MEIEKLIKKYKGKIEIPIYFGIDEKDNKPVLDIEGMEDYFKEEIEKLIKNGYKETFSN